VAFVSNMCRHALALLRPEFEGFSPRFIRCVEPAIFSNFILFEAVIKYWTLTRACGSIIIGATLLDGLSMDLLFSCVCCAMPVYVSASNNNHRSAALRCELHCPN
jgi:hypothetical protein